MNKGICIARHVLEFNKIHLQPIFIRLSRERTESSLPELTDPFGESAFVLIDFVIRKK